MKNVSERQLTDLAGELPSIPVLEDTHWRGTIAAVNGGEVRVG